MIWLYTIYFLTNIIAFAILAVVVAYSWRNRFVTSGKSFLVLAALLQWGIVVDSFAMISPNETIAHICFSLRFIALAGVPLAWLIFTVHYTDRARFLTPLRYAMLFVIPILTQAIILTNPLHGLWVVRDVAFLHKGPFLVPDINARVPGPWFWVHSMYSYFCLAAGMALMFQWSYHMIRTYRAQAMALWFGMIIMTVGSVIPTFNLVPGLKLNPTMLSLVASALLFAWAIFRYHLLDIVPVARDKLVDSMEDCMLVVDLQNRIIDINPPMQVLLSRALSEKGIAAPAHMIGQSVAEMLAPWRDFVEQSLAISSIQEEVVLIIGGVEQFYDLKISPLLDKNNTKGGTVTVLRNITERKRIENEHALSEARLDALYKLSQTEFASEKETIDYALEEAVRLTGSRYGYFHLVREDQENLELVSWSGDVMKTCTTVTDRHYPLSRAGVWADCARTKHPAIHNDYQNLPDRKGYPEGHSHIVRHMSVPIIHKGRVEAIAGVANKSTTYNDSDVRQLQLFMDGVWKIIERKRAEEQLASVLMEKERLLENLTVSEGLLKERNKKMEADLEIAQTVQKAIMKFVRPACPRLAVDVRYKPLDEVGGDYFSFFNFPDSSLGIFIGDVAGHGIASALFTALIKSATTRVFRDFGDTTNLFMKNLNDELVDYMSSYFVTGIYGLFSPCSDNESITFKFTVAAHPFPVIKRRGGDYMFSGVSNDIIGLTSDVHYVENTESLASGDRIFLYTDGIPETLNPRRKPIGFDRGLLDLLRRSERPALPDMLDKILNELAAYRQGNPMRDDLTIIGIEVL